MLDKLKSFFAKKYYAYPLFWGYNFIYVAVLLFVSQVFLFMLTSSFVPDNVAAMIYVLLLTPFAMVTLGLIKQFRALPDKILKLFFGIELPVVILAFIRLIFIREMTPILWLLFLSLFISMAGLLLILFDYKPNKVYKKLLLLYSQEVSLIIAIYFCILAAFMIPIVAAFIIKMLWDINYLAIIEYFFNALIDTKGLVLFSFTIGLMFFLLFLLTMLFFIVSPIVCVVIYRNAFIAKMNDLKESLTLKKIHIATFSFAAVYLVVAILLALQPNSEWYVDNLDKIKQARNFDARQPAIKDLMAKDQKLKNTLIYDYLAQYRFMGDKNIDFLKQAYFHNLNCDKATAFAIQKVFNDLALPFVFNGDFDESLTRAKNDYAEIFDAHIQDGERESIHKALKATNSMDEFKAGLLDKDQKTVMLVKRNVNILAPEKDPAVKVSITEEFENVSRSDKEVYYEFYLPPEAVVTGMTLGPKLEYKGIISSKGAARRTYENQVSGNFDPSLLEQTGPRQYRLRIYPVQTKLSQFRFNLFRNNSFNSPSPSNQKIKFEYIVYNNNKNNTIPMPVITDSRNVFSNQKTQYFYSLNKTPLTELKDKLLNEIPGKIKYSDTKNILFSKINDQYVYCIPYDQFKVLSDTLKKPDNSFLSLLRNNKIAVMLDYSYSNHKYNWQKQFLQDSKFSPLFRNNKVDFYLFNYELSRKFSSSRVDLIKDYTPYGKTQRLNCIHKIKGEYDLILMLTDDSDYDQYVEDLITENTATPIYMVHITDLIPQYNDELTLEIIKSRGNAFTSLIQAIKNFDIYTLAINNQLADAEIIDIDDKGVWYVSDQPLNNQFKGVDINELDKSPLLNTIAISKYIKYLIAETDTTKLKNIYKIHLLARENSIVTPFSSLISLVNDFQLQQLEEAEKQKDRFKAEYSIGEENLSAPSSNGLLTSSSVPEPEEWMLILTIIALLLAYIYRKRLQCLIKQ